MKTLLPLLAASASVFAQGDPHAAWLHQQTLDVPGTGLVRIEVPTSTINASRPRLEDVRLVKPTGLEAPYRVEWPQPRAVKTQGVAAFRASLRDATTVLELETGTDQPISAVSLDPVSSTFIKAATIEGSMDGAQWQSIAKDEVIFRQGESRRLRVPFSSSTWKQLRVTINDARERAVVFSGASVEIEPPGTATTALPVALQKREELKGHTRLTLSLGTANLWVANLRVQTSEPVFNRQVQLLANERVIGSNTLFRVALDGHEAAELEVPIQAQVTAREVVLDIDNGDSPPLKIEGVEARRYPVTLTFYAEQPGPWKLFTGNNAVLAPTYDLGALGERLRHASAVTAKVADLTTNSDFDKAAALPDTGTAGASIDLKGWSYRKLVTTAESGVVQVTLDQETLAHGSALFNDVRLVQSGHQLPYLLERALQTSELQVPFTADPDEKRPTVSRWQIKLPIAGLPVARLVLTSTTSLFDRQLSLREARRDYRGNSRIEYVGMGSWDQKPGLKVPLAIGLASNPQSDTLILETDNGDNAPIQLAGITAALPIVQVRFKTTDAAPIHIYYGNSRASTPRYDLQLVAAELRAATPVKASLGKEEVLKVDLTNTRASGIGSPWLWVALGLVVVGLLTLIARLLPAT